MKTILKVKILVLALLFVPASVFANSDHSDFSEAEKIINNQTPCSELTQDQLQHIGDYYMEQMHPGEEHKLMDQMMGGEGSVALKQMHINMAKRIYCQDTSAMGANMGMMMPGVMMSSDGQNFQRMNSGMIGNDSWGQNMMSGWNWFSGLLGFYMILAIIFLGTGIAAFIKYLTKDKKK